MNIDPFKLRQPFFRPQGRRLAVSGAVFAWALIELILGNPLWAFLFAALGGYLAYMFFVRFDPADYDDAEQDGPRK